eukprot:gene11620-13028_t
MAGLVRENSLKQVQGIGGASHSFSENEKEAFSEHINICLSNDPVLRRHLPLDPSSMELFSKTQDGLIICKLINLASPYAIDERAMNTKEEMNIYQKTENQNLALNAAKSIGCQIINIGSFDLIEGRPVLVLGLIWQIIRIQLLGQISLKNIPELVLLLNEGESMADFLKLNPEVILMRWLNYHLQKAKSSRVAANFGSDLADSEIYSTVLNRLNPALCPPIEGTDPQARAAQAIEYCKRLGVNVFIKPKDIVEGNRKLNVSLVAQLFNTCHGLVMEEEQKATLDFSQLEIDDVGDSREERVFRMWINSLNIEGVYVNNLFADSSDGVNLLKVIDVVQPSLINWRRVNLEPASRFKKVENGNYIIETGKAMKLSLINVGGLDIVDGNKKMILAVIWQLMRKYTLKVLENLGHYQGLSEVSEDHIIAWANARVLSSGKRSKIRNFKDSSLSNSKYLLDLIAAIEPRAVDWENVSDGTDNEALMANARYAISAARKIGACVFIIPEDIVEVKSKMILTFLASLWTAEFNRG